MPLRNKTKRISGLDPKLIEALKEFPQFVRKRHANMRKNLAVITRIGNAIVKEFKAKGIKP